MNTRNAADHCGVFFIYDVWKIFNFGIIIKSIMKKIFLFIAILLPTFIKAQQYVPFRDSNAVWSEYCSSWEMNDPPPSYYYRYILKNTDTLVNYQTYHKIFYSLIDSSYNSTDTSLKYAGGIRENNKIVYFIPKDSTTEYVLYDFSKHKGDTIVYKYSVFAPYYGEAPVNTLIITNTDLIQLSDGTFRIRDSLSFLIQGHKLPCFDYLWIEGIGSTWGLLTPIGDIPTKSLSGRHTLLCFKKDTDIIYHVGNNNDCYLITSNINEITENDFKSFIFPNPATNNLTIDVSNLRSTIFVPSTGSGQVLRMYDVVGNLVLEKNFNTNITDVNVSSLPKGMYFVKVETESGMAVEKFVKE